MATKWSGYQLVVRGTQKQPDGGVFEQVTLTGTGNELVAGVDGNTLDLVTMPVELFKLGK